MAGEVLAEARSARSVFLADDQAVAAPAGSTAAAVLYARASAGADVFTDEADRLRRRLAQESDILGTRSGLVGQFPRG